MRDEGQRRTSLVGTADYVAPEVHLFRTALECCRGCHRALSAYSAAVQVHMMYQGIFEVYIAKMQIL